MGKWPMKKPIITCWSVGTVTTYRTRLCGNLIEWSIYISIKYTHFLLFQRKACVKLYTSRCRGIQLPSSLMNLCHIKRDHPVHIICSRCPPSAEMHAGWSNLIWHNFVTVGDNWIKMCSLAYIGTHNRRVNFFSARQHAERAICYRPSVRLSVCLSVCLSVRHTGGSVKNGWTYHRNSFTIW